MSEQFSGVAKALGQSLFDRHILLRGGEPLLALPRSSVAAQRSLNLYQPQRGMAKLTAELLRKGCHLGLHRVLLKKLSADSQVITHKLLPEKAAPESIGILFGNTKHRVMRAVLSYCNGNSWEVGKLASGSEGVAMLEREAAVMRDIGSVVPEVPELLGLETSETSRLLRMPYLSGRCLEPGDVEPVLRLLQSWLSDEPTKPLCLFPEWPSITLALEEVPEGERFLQQIADLPLRPSIRHGDLARWNLLRTSDGRLKVLDWEWGERHGLPGIDLVHYLSQDFRLVRKLAPIEAVEASVKALESPVWRTYLNRAGWAGYARELVIACLAYKQGARHQDNEEILKVTVVASL